MWKILLFDSSGIWFSTVQLKSIYGCTQDSLQRVKNEIKKNLDYWQSPITWSLFYDDQNMTKYYKQWESS